MRSLAQTLRNHQNPTVTFRSSSLLFLKSTTNWFKPAGIYQAKSSLITERMNHLQRTTTKKFMQLSYTNCFVSKIQATNLRFLGFHIIKFLLI